MFSYTAKLTNKDSVSVIIPSLGFFDVKEMNLIVQQDSMLKDSPWDLFSIIYDEEVSAEIAFQMANDALKKSSTSYRLSAEGKKKAVFGGIPALSYLSIKHLLEQALDGSLYETSDFVNGLSDYWNRFKGEIPVNVDSNGIVHSSKKTDTALEYWRIQLTQKRKELSNLFEPTLVEELKISSHREGIDQIEGLYSVCSPPDSSIKFYLDELSAKKLVSGDLFLPQGIYETKTGLNIFVQKNIELIACDLCCNSFLVPLGYRKN